MIEQLRPGVSAQKTRVCLFDFDGTLSVIRSGWMDVMVPMMVEILRDLKTGETDAQLKIVVEDFVWKLTGKQTIYQMMAFADNITKRGGTPKNPLEYKHMYLDLLNERIHDRLEDLRGGCDPDKYTVPGTRQLLEALRARGLKLFLASGTDQPYMRAEADLLQVSQYFDGGLFGALDDYKTFSKRILVERLISSSEFSGEQVLVFGDGFVEIEVVKKVGGVAVGVASQEPECIAPDEWKRERLTGVGADFIVPNFLLHDELMTALFPRHAK